MRIDFNIAAIRLLYDMVAADGYISDRELDLLQYKLEREYGLSNELTKDASRVSYGEALEYLSKNATASQKKRVFEDLKLVAGVGVSNVSFSNAGEDVHAIESIVGRCSPEEARLLLITAWALFNNAIVFTLKKSKFRFSKKEIIYLESEENEDIHEELCGETSGAAGYYEEYKAKFALLGFNFIYIPQTCKFLKRKNREHKLIPILRYINPLDNYTDESAHEIAEKIEHLRTDEFARQFMTPTDGLFDRFEESLLMKIKTSYIFEEGRLQKREDFILLPIYGKGKEEESKRSSVGQIVELLCAQYMSYTNQVNPLTYSWGDQMFHFHGFDNTILNMVMSEHFLPTDMNRLVFNLNNEKLELFFGKADKPSCRIPFKNGLKRLLIYIFIVYYSQTSCGGLYVIKNDEKDVIIDGVDVSAEMQYANRAYGKLIGALSNKAKADMFSRLPSCISDIRSTFNNIENYPPELKLKDEVIMVNGVKHKKYFISPIDKKKIFLELPYDIDILKTTSGRLFDTMNGILKNLKCD